MPGAEDEDLLLAVLNSTPVDRGEQRDELHGQAGSEWLRLRGLPDSAEERASLITARDLLQRLVRERGDVSQVEPLLKGVSLAPSVRDDKFEWRRQLPDGHIAASRVVLAWAELETTRPDRLRPCANRSCRRYLLDRSKANQAKWCSMATCGNRAKARRHYERSQPAGAVKQPSDEEPAVGGTQPSV